MIRKRSYVKEMTTTGGIPDVIGGFAMRRRHPTATIAGIADRVYRAAKKILKRKKRKRRVR